MASLIRRRPAGIVALILIPALALGALVAAPAVVPRLAAWLSPQPEVAPHHLRAAAAPASARPASAIAGTPRGGSPASVRLVAQDLTPSSHLTVTASGFMGGEPLEATIEDAQGHPYEQVTLTAGKDGRLGKTSLALPSQLASGDYRLLVVGDTSHRTASALFRMHDIPPIVVLDTYTSTPGQTVSFAGSGFIPGEVVRIYLGALPAPLASVRATGRGAVSGRLAIPALAAGTYTLNAVGSLGQTPASVGFNIQGFAPWVVLDRYALTPGERVGFIGQGFAASEPVLVYLNASQGSPVLRVTADPSGRIVAQDAWTPSGISGRNVLTFVGEWSKTTTTAEFMIVPAAQSTSTPTTP